MNVPCWHGIQVANALWKPIVIVSQMQRHARYGAGGNTQRWKRDGKQRQSSWDSRARRQDGTFQKERLLGPSVGAWNPCRIHLHTICMYFFYLLQTYWNGAFLKRKIVSSVIQREQWHIFCLAESWHCSKAIQVDAFLSQHNREGTAEIIDDPKRQTFRS